MSARLTSFDTTILEIEEGVKDNSKSQAENDYAACCAIKDWFAEKDSRCTLDDAARYLVNARMSDAALMEMTK
jgi:hypothetical protein